MLEAFNKLEGIDIFSLKTYLENPELLSFEGIFSILNWLFVEIPMFIMNLIVSMFVLLMKILENIDVVSYQKSIYESSKSLWQGMTGGQGLAGNSIIYVLVVFSGLYLFCAFVFTHGSFYRKLGHFLLVFVLGFSWFGTINSQQGGLYLIQSVQNVANEAKKAVSNITVAIGDDKIKVGKSFSDTYLMDISYKAYLYVNTGRTDGKYGSSDGKELKDFEDKKVLGEVKNGRFEVVKSEERQKYFETIANENAKPQNKWVKSDGEFIALKIFYILVKICEAVIRALPILFIEFMSLIAQLLVLAFILFFPVILGLSFIPSFQHLLLSYTKGLLMTAALPSIISLLLVVIFFIDAIIGKLFTQPITEAVGKMSSGASSGLLELILKTVVSVVVYMTTWRYKEEILGVLLSNKVASHLTNMSDRVVDPVQDFALEHKERVAELAMFGAGLAVGGVMNSPKNMKSIFGSRRIGQSAQDLQEESNYAGESNLVSPVAVGEEVYDNFEHFSEEQEQVVLSRKEPDYAGESISVSPVAVDEEVPDNFEHSVEEQEQVVLSRKEPDYRNNARSIKEEYISPRKQRKIDRIEERLQGYTNPEDFVRGHGRNAFMKGVRSSLNIESRIIRNLEKREQLARKLEKLRGER